MLLYAATIALSAFLLFMVQPIIAKQILPWFGGSAAVWTTCMVFFQVTLLAGYFYSDLVIRKLDARRQAILHSVLLVASLALLPITAAESFKPVDADNPIGRILLLLAVTIGLPYLLLSTTGPLVQAWFTRKYQQGQVYRLYALSNVASMLALIAYPPIIEPNSTSIQQSIGWSAGYAVFVVLAIAAAWMSAKYRQPPAITGTVVAADVGTAPAGSNNVLVEEAATQATAPPTWQEQALWLVLAALGSVLLLAITTHITQNVASIPFLWVLPLAIYLVTFILCFDGKNWYWRPWYLSLTALLVVLMLGGLKYRLSDSYTIERGIMHIEQAVPLYAFGLFVLCMFCHGELVAHKPAPKHLTRFYLMVSLGGAIGGLTVGIAAPLLLDWYWEFPAALTLAAVLALYLSSQGMRLIAGAALLGCLWLFTDYAQSIREDTIELSRNFYGTLRVKTTGPDSDENAKWRLLHGVITHGEQYRAEKFKELATTYYGESSGVGRAIEGLRVLKSEPQRIGLIGLGVGTLASYGQNGDVYRIYELNPQVVDLARRRFSYLKDSEAKVETPLGDARLVLEREAPQQFDVLAVDAFSSDSIPVHLITKEAIQVYRRHMKPDGVITFHISNRYLDLTGVVRQLADEIGWKTVRIIDDPGDASYLYRSDWILITANQALIDRLAGEQIGDEVPRKPGLRVWTDSYNNLFEVLK